MMKFKTGVMAFVLMTSVSVCGAAPGDLSGNSPSGSACDLRNGGNCVSSAALSGGTGSLSAMPEVNVARERDAKPRNCDVFVASESEYSMGVVFTVDRPVRDFAFLALEIKEMTPDGKAYFNTKELYKAEWLNPERPLLVKLVFIGDIPNNGISYTDRSGNKRTFALYPSGIDGTLLFTEINR